MRQRLGIYNCYTFRKDVVEFFSSGRLLPICVISV